MQEVTEITLPKSGAKVGLRAYVRVGDRRKVNKFLMSGIELGQNDNPDSVKISAERALDAQDLKIKTLLISVQFPSHEGEEAQQPALSGEAAFNALMDLRDEEDIQAVEAKVAEVFGDATAEDAEKK